MTNTEIVRASFAAYVDQDREAADALLADDFVFTSPQDDHIDKATWFERCYPVTGPRRQVVASRDELPRTAGGRTRTGCARCVRR